MLRLLPLLFIFLLLLPVMTDAQSATATNMSAADLIRLHELVLARGTTELPSARYLELADQFTVLAEKYPEEWLPAYYAGLMAAGSVFDESFISMTAAEINAQCDRVEKLLASCTELGAPADAVLVLRALISYGRIRGGASISISNFIARAALEEAQEINPLNPRVYSLLGQGVYFSPASSGGGPAQAKVYFETALTLFAEENPEPGTPEYLLPHWGEPRAHRYMERCIKGQQIIFDERMKNEKYETSCY